MAGVSFDQSDRGLQSKSRLLNPDFPLIRTWRLLSTILLLYVAIVVQVQVGFFWYKPLCEPMPTEAVDIFIDCFFLLELVLNFLTGVWHDGIYHDRFAYVAWRYLHTSLLFDVITSFPIAIVEFAVRSQACKEIHADDSADGTNYSRLRLLRTLKPLRIFKLLRLLKAGKISSLIEAIDARLHLPVFMLRMLKIYLAQLGLARASTEYTKNAYFLLFFTTFATPWLLASLHIAFVQARLLSKNKPKTIYFERHKKDNFGPYILRKASF